MQSCAQLHSGASRHRSGTPVLAWNTRRHHTLKSRPLRAVNQHNTLQQHPQVTVFTTPGCQYCRQAKQTLTEQEVPFQEVDVSACSKLRQALQQATGQRTVPQVYVNGTLVGGSDRLTTAVADGSLAQLLQSTDHNLQSLPAALEQALQAAAATQPQGSQAQLGTASGLPADLQQLVGKLTDSTTGIARTPAGQSQPTNAFTGQALVEWLHQHSSSSSSQDNTSQSSAVVIAQQLLQYNIITVVSQQQPSLAAAAGFSFQPDATHWYRLRSDAPRAVPWGAALNTAYWWGPAPARPAEVVAEELRGRILALYDKYLSADGKSVQYKALRADPAFWEYVDATAELQRVDLSGLSREALMCFAINLYNALCIHTLVVHGPDKYNDFFGRLEFFRKAARYNIGGSDYVLDDLENGMLRGNAPGAATVGMLLKLPQLSQGPFKQGDPRAQHVVRPVDARIHFALVCGAVSCPPIKLYSTDTLEEGLAAAAEAFCASEVSVDVAAKKVEVSKIFDWYYPDFGDSKAARLRFLLPYLQAEQRSRLDQLLAADPNAAGIKVTFKPYDWTINAAAEE